MSREREREKRGETRMRKKCTERRSIFERAAKLFPLCRALSRYLGCDLDFDQFRRFHEEEKNSMVSLFPLSLNFATLSISYYSGWLFSMIAFSQEDSTTTTTTISEDTLINSEDSTSSNSLKILIVSSKPTIVLTISTLTRIKLSTPRSTTRSTLKRRTRTRMKIMLNWQLIWRSLGKKRNWGRRRKKREEGE